MLNLDLFRHTLASRIGRVLTAEDAAAIEVAARTPIDNTRDPKAFGSVITSDGITIQAELLRDILQEIHALHEEHWLETEKHRHGLKLDLDYDFMVAKEQAGELIQFTARLDGKLVGNLRMYVGLSRHTKTLFAEEDTLYLTPSVRGGFTAMTLMRFAESSLLSIGVQEIRADSKLVNNADVLMRRLRYQPVALKFVKVFKERSHVQ